MLAELSWPNSDHIRYHGLDHWGMKFVLLHIEDLYALQSKQWSNHQTYSLAIWFFSANFDVGDSNSLSILYENYEFGPPLYRN